MVKVRLLDYTTAYGKETCHYSNGIVIVEDQNSQIFKQNKTKLLSVLEMYLYLTTVLFFF